MNELNVEFKMKELGSEGRFYAEYDTMRFPEVAPEPNEGTDILPVADPEGAQQARASCQFWSTMFVCFYQVLYQTASKWGSGSMNMYLKPSIFRRALKRARGGGGGHSTMWLYTRATKKTRKKGTFCR